MEKKQASRAGVCGKEHHSWISWSLVSVGQFWSCLWKESVFLIIVGYPVCPVGGSDEADSFLQWGSPYFHSLFVSIVTSFHLFIYFVIALQYCVSFHSNEEIRALYANIPSFLEGLSHSRPILPLGHHRETASSSYTVQRVPLVIISHSRQIYISA